MSTICLTLLVACQLQEQNTPTKTKRKVFKLLLETYVYSAALGTFVVVQLCSAAKALQAVDQGEYPTPMMPICQALSELLCKPILPTSNACSTWGSFYVVQKCRTSSCGGLSAKVLFFVISGCTCSKVLLSHDKLEVLCLRSCAVATSHGQCICNLTWTQRLPLICWWPHCKIICTITSCIWCWLACRCRLVHFEPASQLALAGVISVVWEKRHVCRQAKCVEHGCRGPHHAPVSDSGNYNSNELGSEQLEHHFLH